MDEDHFNMSDTMNTSVHGDIINDSNAELMPSSQNQVVPVPFIPYIAWLILISCVGTVGNVLVIFAVIVNRDLRTISNIFVVNLAFADLFVTTVIDPFAVVAVFNNGAFFYLPPDEHSSLCIFLGAFVVTCCGCSIWTIVAISVERYVQICHPGLHPKIFNRQTAPFIVTTLWIIALAIALPYFEVFGWGIYGYFTKGRICTCIFNVSYYYGLYLIGLELALPMIIIPYCYFRIYLVVRKSKQRLQKHRAVVVTASGTASRKSQQDESEMRILKMVVTIWVVFMTMWAPYTCNVLLDFDASWPDSFFITAVAFCLSNSSINFIIYGIMNTNFRRGYLVVIQTMLSCVRKRDASHRDERTNTTGFNNDKDGISSTQLRASSDTLAVSTMTADVYLGPSHSDENISNQNEQSAVVNSNI